MSEQTLTERIADIIRAHGAQCTGVDIRGTRSRRLIDVYADTERGISADELADISRALGPVIDALLPASTDYTLMVSSPGLDQPLRAPWQFRRHAGRRIRLTVTGASGDEVQAGVIVDADESAVTLRIDDADHRIPLDRITEAYVQPSLK